MNEAQQKPIHFVPHLVGQRFFTVPRFDTTADAPVLKAHLRQPDETIKRVCVKENKIMRYAGYMRVSSEEQVGNFSIDAQRRAIEEWIKAQGGKRVKAYVDEAQSGRTADRPVFQEMRRDARKSRFDALVVHKFDRFARNRTDALTIKSLLRQDCGIKVFSVTEPSEDSDGPIGALIEGIMECVADWYSRNLATETAKGKRERARQGHHNNRPPFGYDKTKEGPTRTNWKVCAWHMKPTLRERTATTPSRGCSTRRATAARAASPSRPRPCATCSRTAPIWGMSSTRRTSATPTAAARLPRQSSGSRASMKR